MDAHLSAIVQYGLFGRIDGTFQPGLQYGRFWMLRHPVLKYIGQCFDRLSSLRDIKIPASFLGGNSLQCNLDFAIDSTFFPDILDPFIIKWKIQQSVDFVGALASIELPEFARAHCQLDEVMKMIGQMQQNLKLGKYKHQSGYMAHLSSSS
jgi:hypothetical protein